MRITRTGALVALLGIAAACQEPATSNAPSRPSFSAGATIACPTPGNVIVHNEAGLLAALSSATPGEVIALDTLFPVTADLNIPVEGVTLTCATPGAGIFAAPGAGVVEMITAGANGVVVDHLVLDASALDATGDPYLAIDVAGVRLTNSIVTCSAGSCGVLEGTRNAVVADNSFTSAGSFTGVHLQLSDLNGIDGSRVERNTVVATGPSVGLNLGGIRVRDGSDVVVAENVVRGPWTNSIATADLVHSRFERNSVEGALFVGLRLASGASFVPISMTDNVFSNNRVTGAGSAGLFARLACRNTFVGNSLQGNAGNLGLAFDVTTGANILVGNQNVVVDNGSFDCDGDGVADPNIINGPGRVLRGPVVAPPASAAATVRRRGIEVR
ncbi:MAG: hypothetical protein AUH78_07030 [Gemmatimonadetes bacterium 13_1_40CM_4_69_8]|nr:MAG: hypothetical protein AUH78_07030 [Gemmatimonadetes bacterium 13_1_40CM_4_69_8]